MSIPRYERTVVTACMTRQGTPTFVLTKVAVTEQELENGIQYDLVDSQLLIDEYEEPFVHFDQAEAPPFLIPAVRAFLAVNQPALSEAS